jgi:hypothetical protein
MDKSNELQMPAALFQGEEYPTSHWVAGYLSSKPVLKIFAEI